MLLFSLDEQGDFENPSSDLPKFIAGEIYDDEGDKHDLDNERNRIKQYYTKVCQTVECSFPRDLHCGNNNDKKVYLVKKEINKTLPEFLKRGTYQNSPLLFTSNGKKPIERKGHYYIFCMIKSKSGKTNLLGNNISLLANDEAASNLYVHMAEALISRIIFYNPLIPQINNICLDLATRLAVTNDDNRTKQLRYQI